MASPLNNAASIAYYPDAGVTEQAAVARAFGHPVGAIGAVHPQLLAEIPAHEWKRDRQFLNACKNGDNDTVQRLLIEEPNLCHRALQAVRPLAVAIQRGHVSTVDLLLDHGASPNSRLSYQPPLTEAISYRQQAVARRLIERGADLELKTEGGYTALHEAVRANSSSLVTLLLAAGADVHANSSCQKDTPLTQAVECQYRDMVELLLVTGHADPDQRKGNTGKTPLSIACEQGCLAIVELLLARGATADRGEHEGPTPLALAAQNGFLQITETLLQYGADPKETDSEGKTVRQRAEPREHHDVVALLRAAEGGQ